MQTVAMTGPPLISTSELNDRLGEPDLRIIDASWHLDGRDGRPDFEAARVPGAVFFDLEASSESAGGLPHMLPSPEAFAARMDGLGLAAEHRIVVYDTSGVRAAPRAWWMFRIMGADRVQVLDGGLPKWLAEGRPVDSGPPATPDPVDFRAAFRRELLADLEAVRQALDGGAAQIVDARPAARFAGRADEPRPGLRRGHMPGAKNLPFPDLLTPAGTMKPRDELEAVFRDADVALDRPVITTCGSGVTAAIVSLALAVLGRDSRLYDGSWAEWGGRDDTPVAI